MSNDSELTGEGVWYAHERRIQRLEDGMTNLGRAIVKMERDVEENNKLTMQIRDDTREIRDLVRGTRAVGKIAIWMGAIAGMLVSLYTLGVLK